MTREELEAKLLANREIDANGCWLWTRCTDGPGYGQISLGERQRTSAHRLAASLWLEFDLAAPLFVLHRCDTPRCFNPEHLFIGTPSDNVRDMHEKGRARHVGQKGHRNNRSRLMPADVLRIRAMLADGIVQYEIARQFAVTQAAISCIARGATWTHL